MIEAVRGHSFGYRRLGSAILPDSDEERTLLIESEQLLQDDGFSALWDGTRLVNPRDGEVDPVALVAAFARQAKPGGIRESMEVTGLVPNLHGVTVTAGEVASDAGVVILATNGYTSQLVPRVKIEPTRAQLLATVPETKAITDLPVYSHFGYHYWPQLSTGAVLVGAWRDKSLDTEQANDEGATPANQQP